MMKRRNFLRKSGMAAAGVLAAGPGFSKTEAKSAPSYRPNIVMITSHDLGQHLGCYGVKTVQTGNIDKLAGKGVRFKNFYSSSSVCSPGRGSLHTGRYPQSNGLMGLTHAPWWWALKDDEKHTASYLADLGYETILIGLNHIHSDTKRLGYQKKLSTKRKAQESVQAAKDLFDKAKKGDAPFFAKIGFTEVHRPFGKGKDTRKGVFVPPWLQNTDQVREDLEDYQGLIKFFDERVGEILDAIEASEVAGDTLVILTADHGIPYPGAKWCARKAGFEAPLILHQPGTAMTGGKVFEELMSNIDVLPTLLDLLGADIPAKIQGLSFKKVIEGKAGKAPRREVFGQYTPDMKRDNISRSVITERYQLIRYFDQGRSVDYPVDVHPQTFAAHQERCKTKGTRPFAQLYDLQNDPYELKDIGSEPGSAPIVADLSRRLLAWMREVDDALLQGPLQTPYYDRSMEDFLKNDKG